MQTKNIIIVGAGPAGLAVAAELRKISDFNIVILEKNAEISYKVCAGGISPEYSKIDLPKEIINREFKRIKIFTPSQSIILEENRSIAATTSRKLLCKIMAEKAARLGVKILFNKFVKEINANLITTNAGDKFIFDYLIGADGSNSIVRKNLGLKTKKMIVAFQYIIPQNYPDMEFFVDFEKFGPSYAWIFPQKETISAGTGYDPNLFKNDFTIQKLRKNFDLWCAKKFDMKNAKFEAFPINYDYRGFDFGNIYLAGDAAGFASGFTGEGIRFAILSGKDIARKICDPNYKCAEIENILKIKKRGENFIRLLASNQIIAKPAIEFLAFLLKTPLGKKMAGRVL